MRYSWKKHLLAAAVSVAILTFTTTLTFRSDASLGKQRFLDRDAHAYEVNSAGNVVGVLIVAIGFTAAILLPYELTLRILDSKRLSGED
ncbi:hypothetical protein [Terriglobus sp. TAA 43]|uniref:hypothetical protein n=1 Tax=Terriglobus sp. TAA 43 TaxID=278961 RepID=UPI0006473240|nr:hypothetical protein [Terriglobus sp. TAA 43]